MVKNEPCVNCKYEGFNCRGSGFANVGLDSNHVVNDNRCTKRATVREYSFHRLMNPSTPAELNMNSPWSKY